ncbi:MAG: esterase-like activity of phytase family protein [Bdellovibrio sp.]|nr:esterase-like activity of phytase family protein [Bdellovibrio sp.]
MKSALVLASFLGLLNSAQALTLRYVGETSIKTGTKFDKTVIGGLSGMVWQDKTLYALSDDKGKAGEPRFYSFDLKIDKSKVELTPKKVTFIRGLPKENGQPAFIDPEGFARLPDGDFLISSEASTDKKPRTKPRVFRVSAEGVWKSDFVIPEKYIPEPLGKQTKGVQNSQSFEGLTTLDNGKFVFTALESCLTQDIVEGADSNGDLIRILKFEDRGAQHGYYTPTAEYAYHVDALKSSDKGPELFRGVSEILAISDSKMFVMERGVRANGKGWTNAVVIYLADLSKASNTLALDKISDAKINLAEKTKLVDFETDLVKERGNKVVDNFEALSWGPTLPDGRRTLLVMVDNNFSKNETTELVVFAVEGE